MGGKTQPETGPVDDRSIVGHAATRILIAAATTL